MAREPNRFQKLEARTVEIIFPGTAAEPEPLEPYLSGIEPENWNHKWP